MFLGTGSFASVWKAKNLTNGSFVAIKIAKQVTKFAELNGKQVLLEVAILERCQHIEGVIQMLGWSECEKGYCIIMPFFLSVTISLSSSVCMELYQNRKQKSISFRRCEFQLNC